MEQEIQEKLKEDDLYKVLGVTSTDSEQTIQKAYKKLALKYHPDKNHNPGADKMFKKINTAKDILTDPARKTLYEQYGHYNDKDYLDQFAQNIVQKFSPMLLLDMVFGYQLYIKNNNNQTMLSKSELVGLQRQVFGQSAHNTCMRHNKLVKALTRQLQQAQDPTYKAYLQAKIHLYQCHQ